MKMRFMGKTTAIVCAILASCACSGEGNVGGADSDGSLQTEQEATLAEEELLGEVNIGSETFRFSRYVSDGAGTFVIESSRPVGMTSGVLERLYERYPDLTVLETLLALSPSEGDNVPESLREYHVEQAAMQGRADAAVRSVEFDRAPAPLDKQFQTPQTCDLLNQTLAINGEIWQANRLNRADIGNGVFWDGNRLCPVFQGFPGCDHQSVGGTHLLNVCNVGASLIGRASTRTNSGPWVLLPNVTIPGGFNRTWRILATKTGFFTDMKVAGLQFIPPFGGGTFYVRAGYALTP